MASKGLSLVGFMNESAALGYFRARCLTTGLSDNDLLEKWNQAKDQIGPAMVNAGEPEILDLPAHTITYLQQVTTNPRFAETVNGAKWAFKLIDIDKVLAFQFDVDINRTEQLCVKLSASPTLEEALELCLPANVEDAQFNTVGGPGGLTIQSKSLNLRPRIFGTLGQDPNQQVHFAGLAFGMSSPLVQVARYNGKCYLRNGFHRTFGLRTKGMTHVPCLLLDVNDPTEIGINPPGTFAMDLLISQNPPTCGHFAGGRAYEVDLRSVMRVIHVNLSEYVLPLD